jgi:uncharacterized repeat protein (TIGR03803 family)
LTPSGSGWTFRTIYAFGQTGDGRSPYASLVVDGSGNLYGTTVAGGTNGGGTVFELSPQAGGNWTERVLYSFTSASNGGPWEPLTFDALGNLYGATEGSGIDELGNVFELINYGGGAWGYTSLYDFTGDGDGRNPYSSVAVDSNGNLYGTASHGGNPNCHTLSGTCGVVWQITP